MRLSDVSNLRGLQSPLQEEAFCFEEPLRAKPVNWRGNQTGGFSKLEFFLSCS